jgi:hypothetical protein
MFNPDPCVELAQFFIAIAVAVLVMVAVASIEDKPPEKPKGPWG